MELSRETKTDEDIRSAVGMRRFRTHLNQFCDCLGCSASQRDEVHIATPEDTVRNQTWAQMIAHTISVYEESSHSA